MPKKMFFNIKEDKRNMFLDVAVEEFTTKSFEQVSVNTIIKKANISRGSFYTYFDDLEALFNYIIKEVINNRFEYAKKLLQNCNGDYFLFIKSLFEYDFDSYSTSGKYSLFRNYIHYIQSSKKSSLKDAIIAKSLLGLIENNDIKSVFNFDELKINEQEFIDLLEIVVILMINTFLKSENENLSKKETIRLFNKRLSFIEYGVRKENIE
ncbi:DNA-binding transcriptional repressor AcrR [Candidatus Izimaplasma bacterium HR1]|jgi:AcrR family transcriptional regulator|uniref:TetR/AcrR family transcriptional regulator n=1 Tax=Candidatus Izimoplasma sp. HR1 TaxID=1541959 RepID=UPI0004F74B8B|nr:DNA-binding transcriptional repressor AcrR [Candidatus Izimaplasma bacterium HR1]